MIADSIKFRGHRCFKNDFVGFEQVKLINIVIGRNNTGKSHLLDLVRSLCRSVDGTKTALLDHCEYQFKGRLDVMEIPDGCRGFFKKSGGGCVTWTMKGASVSEDDLITSLEPLWKDETTADVRKQALPRHAEGFRKVLLYSEKPFGKKHSVISWRTGIFSQRLPIKRWS